MQIDDTSKIDGKGILALWIEAIRAERFCESDILSFFKKGQISQCLLGLTELNGESLKRVLPI